MRTKIKTSLFFGLLLTTLGSQAAEPPAVGLWQKYPVTDGSFKLVARPQYVFTNKKIDGKTIFTGLNEIGGTLSTLCCVLVKNTTPLVLADVLKKYAADEGFVEHMKSVHGLPFLYQAEPVGKADRNEYFQTVMNTDNDPQDTSPFSAAVVGASLNKQDNVKPHFQVGSDRFQMKANYPENKNIVKYEFKINDKIVKFSEDTPIHDAGE